MTLSLLWLRQDLRVSDHPALAAAMAEGEVLPVYVLDDEGPAQWSIGGAQRWWLHHSLTGLAASHAKRGATLVLRRGRSADVLKALVAETGARRVHALRHYEAWHQKAERELGSAVDLVLHEGNQLAPPDSIRNGSGERYRVFTPWYNRLLERMPPSVPRPAPESIPGPPDPPPSDRLEDWGLLPRSPDWSTGFSDWKPGEKGARAALARFLRDGVAGYAKDRDFPAIEGTSRLSPHLHFGEVSPATVWHAAGQGVGAASFLREVAWREHGLNLVDQMPDYAERNGRPAFDHLAWRDGPDADADFRAWTRGRTGYPVVDAGMRELWRTGWMHNRVRMVTASFLVKHLLIDWRRGERWFWDTLLDADLGANAMNWQYVAGSGVDAPVFSRIMAPHLQCAKFDMGGYVREFVPELTRESDGLIEAMHRGGPRPAAYPPCLISHEAARARALAAWQALRQDG